MYIYIYYIYIYISYIYIHSMFFFPSQLDPRVRGSWICLHFSIDKLEAYEFGEFGQPCLCNLPIDVPHDATCILYRNKMANQPDDFSSLQVCLVMFHLKTGHDDPKCHIVLGWVAQAPTRWVDIVG